MILDRVTVTGADDSIEPGELVALSAEFPFVEWGILLSRSNEGKPRYPTLAWIERLFSFKPFPAGVTLSGHLCGAWVRDLCRGGRAFALERPTIADRFDRLQLNFHAQAHEVNPAAFVSGLRELQPEHGYIFQFDDINDDLMAEARAAGIDAATLYDISGGCGILPDSWPATAEAYSGYAGGLSPDNLAEQLPRIAAAARCHRVWIDVETHVRSINDRLFDLQKVARFLRIAEPWVSADRQRR